MSGGRDDEEDALHVVLVEPEIHWNTGNVGRTCLATGARLHLVEPLGFSLDDKAVRRAGLDYWPHVDPVVWPSWTALATHLPRLGAPYFISPEGAQPYWSAEYGGPRVLVFGRESIGLPPEVRAAHTDRLLRVPMFDRHVRSLNLSTCVGVVVYEALRQRARAAAPP